MFRSIAIVALFLSAPLPVFGQSVVYTPWSYKNVPTRGMGFVTGIAISARAPYDVYVKTDVGGAYRFDRSATRWTALLDAIPLGEAPIPTSGGVGVESIAVDPTSASTVYLVVPYVTGRVGNAPYEKYTRTGEVLRSTDRGRNWTTMGMGSARVRVAPNGAYRDITGERLAIDPANPNSLFFASRVDGLWRTDGGLTWTQVGGGLPSPDSVPNYWTPAGPDLDQPGFAFVAIANPATAGARATYVGITGSGVWRSLDGGLTWANIGGPTDSGRGVVAADGTVYVSGRSGLSRFSGGTWTDIRPRQYFQVEALGVDPVASGTVIASSDSLVFRSTDYGATWTTQRLYMGATDPRAGTPVNPSAPGYFLDFSSAYPAAVAVDPSDRRSVWRTNGFGVHRTSDITAAQPVWSWQMKNLEELVVNTVLVPPLKGGAAFLTGAFDMLGLRYADRSTVPTQHFNPVGIATPSGYEWANGSDQQFPSPFPHVAGVTSIDYAYRAPARMAMVGLHQWQFVGIHGTSDDNGRSWTAFPALPSDTLYDGNGTPYAASAIAGQVAMSPTNPLNIIWAPAYGSYPQVTLDGGRTWRLMRDLDATPPTPTGGPPTIASTHWQYLAPTFSNSISPWVVSNLLSADRADPTGQTFYYLAFTTLYITHDGGLTWRKGASQPEFPSFIVHPNLLSNPATPGDLWLVFARNDDDVRLNPLFHSTDGGLTFTAVAGVSSCNKATFGAPSIAGGPPTLYIAGRVGSDSADALYKSPDLGQTWTRISDPATQAFPGMSAIEGDMRTRDLLYIGTAGRGVMFGTPTPK